MRARLGFLAVLACAAAAWPAHAAALDVHIDYGPRQIVDVPASIPHAEGAMLDSRIVDQALYLSQAYDVYIGDGWSGPLPGGGFAGCHGCHVSNSDHFRGLALDMVPAGWDGEGCDASWKQLNLLARRLEPRQGHPLFPFRFVGYNGDFHHGCGDHLHLSWTYAPTPKFKIARWVWVFEPPALAALER